MTEICKICETDEATQRHHVLPKSKGGKDTVWCCDDCGGQVHMFFNNNELANMTLEQLLNTDKMRAYIAWKKKHPGKHKHRMSTVVKQWKKGHR